MAERTTRRKAQISEAASLLGKRSWKVRVERFGIERLRQNAAKMGKQSEGRPRLPDEQVTPAALYQRARRERMKREAAAGGAKERTVSNGKARKG